MKRNLISEIQSIKSRSNLTSAFEYVYQLRTIEEVFEQTQNNGYKNSEFLKYIPIAIVACFEAFFSKAVKELIDSGSPFNDNVSNFNQSKNIKIDFDVLAAIQTKTLTIGEFVAHLLPYNNLIDISSNIAVITGNDFLTHLKSFNKESIFEENIETIKNFQNRSAEIILSVKKVYELRHIFCHEFGTKVDLDYDELKALFYDCRIFLQQTNLYISELISPNSPETQSEMNQNAYEQSEESNARLDSLLSEIKKISQTAEDMDSFDYQIFLASMEHWEQYRSAHAAYSASCVKGGSMYPLLYSSDLKWKTDEKIASLEKEFSNLLKVHRTKSS